MKTVLLVAEGAADAELGKSLADLGWSVRNSAPRQAVEAARAERPSAVVVAAFVDATAARFVSHLIQNLREDPPIVVVALPVADAALRDACLVAGADDIVCGSAIEAAAGIDAAVGEWLRGAVRTPFAETIRAQQARKTFELKGIDLDASGFAFEPTDAVLDGQLVRVTLPLPGGELLVWARVSQADGQVGARFVALSADERQRVGAATQRSKDVTLPPRATPLGTPVVPGPPPASRAAGTPIVPGPPPTSRPAAVRPAAMAPPVVAATTPPVATPVSAVSPTPLSVAPVAAPAVVVPAPPSALIPPAPSEITAPPAVLVPAAPAEEPVAAADSTRADAAPQAPAASDHGSLLDAIDEELGTPKVAAEADVLEGLLGSALEHRWPQSVPEVDATLASLQTAATLGLVGEQAGAPSGDTVLAFVRSVSPLERRLFDPEPPQELPDAGLGIRCLGLRLRMFALQRDAEQRLTGTERYAVDDVVLGALKAEVAQLDASLQKIVDGFVATGQPQKIKDVSIFRNALNKAFADLKRVSGRLRGDADAERSGSAVLLDVAEEVPGQQQVAPVRKDAREPEKKVVEKKPQFARQLTLEQKERRRLIVWCSIGAAALVLRLVTLEPSVKQLDGKDLDGLAGVVEIAIPPGAVGQDAAKVRSAVVRVTDTWSGDDMMVAKLKATLRARGVAKFTVFGPTGRLMGDGRTGPNEPVNIRKRSK